MIFIIAYLSYVHCLPLRISIWIWQTEFTWVQTIICILLFCRVSCGPHCFNSWLSICRCDVTVWNRTKSKCNHLIDLGAKYVVFFAFAIQKISWNLSLLWALNITFCMMANLVYHINCKEFVSIEMIISFNNLDWLLASNSQQSLTVQVEDI